MEKVFWARNLIQKIFSKIFESFRSKVFEGENFQALVVATVAADAAVAADDGVAAAAAVVVAVAVVYRDMT